MTAWSDYVAGREPQQPSPSGAAQQPSTAWSDYVNETPYMGYGGGRPRTSGTDAFLYNLADGATFGWGDEAVGVIEGAGAAVAGGDFNSAFHRRVNAARDRLAAARRDRPLESFAGGLTGGAAVSLAAAPLGVAANAGRLGSVAMALSRMAAGRGSGALLTQMGVGLGAGAVGGAVYGAGAADADDQRLQGALVGAGTGAAFGALAPPAFQALGSRYSLLRGPTGAAIGAVAAPFVGMDPIQGAAIGGGVGLGARPVVMRARNALRNAGAGAASRTNAFLGFPPTPEEAAVSRPTVDEAAVRGVDRLMGREGYGVSELERRINVADDEPRGRVLADVGGQQFEAEADMLAQAPGETPPVARALSDERVREMPGDIDRELSDLLHVQQSPTEALDAIRTAERGANGAYTQLADSLDRQPNGGINRQIISQRLGPLMRTRRMQDVLRLRYEQEGDIAALARARGQQPPSRSVGRDPTTGEFFIDPSRVTARQLFDLKHTVDDVFDAEADRLNMNAKGKGDQRINDDYRHDFINALDDAIPGYRDLRATRGDAYSARKALEDGKRFVNMRPAEVRKRMQEVTTETGVTRPTTEAERRLYQTVVVDELLKKVFRRATDEDGRTVNAAEVLKAVETKNMLRAVFGDGPEVETFLSRLRERSEMLRRATGWQGNSATFRRSLHFADSVGETMQRLARATQGGGVAGAATEMGHSAWQSLIGRHVERSNNALGRALFSRIDNAAPEDRAYLRALIEELRSLERARLGRARDAAPNALTGVVGGGSLLDDE